MNGKKVSLMMAMVISVIALGAVRPEASTQELIRLVSNYPNPFDSRSQFTTIVYSLAEDASVTIKIYDLFGNRVRTFPLSHEMAGLRQLVWDGTDETGAKVAKGGYLCVVDISSDEVEYLVMRKIGIIH